MMQARVKAVHAVLTWAMLSLFIAGFGEQTALLFICHFNYYCNTGMVEKCTAVKQKLAAVFPAVLLSSKNKVTCVIHLQPFQKYLPSYIEKKGALPRVTKILLWPHKYMHANSNSDC